jgi:hypothetical protein
VLAEFINNPLRNSIHSYGLMYHPYAQLCMGRCPMCRDPKLDQKHLRKIKKSEFKQMLTDELEKEDKILSRLTDDHECNIEEC